MASYDDWLCSPPEPEAYDGPCICCDRFTGCPCGCSWGYCEEEPGEFYDGNRDGCEGGVWRSGDDRIAYHTPEPDSYYPEDVV